MELKDIVPWGRLRDEYIRMFALTERELQGTILGCGDGPSSFNFENGANVTSLDPVYQFSKEEIQKRIDETADVICEQLEANKDKYVWSEFKDIIELKQVRLKAMNMFLADFDKGKVEGRYVAGALPQLEFEDKSFDLAFSSHFLFLYSDKLDFNFHLSSIKEMLRVASKVKIFPIADLQGNESKHLKNILSHLSKNGINYSINSTDYEFQKGVGQYLEISNLR